MKSNKVSPKDYAKKYGRALKNAPLTKPKQLLIHDKYGKLKIIQPLDVKYEGSSFGTILDMYRDELERHSEYKKAVGHSISTLISLLKAKGYNTPNTELNALIEDINSLVVIEPDKLYDVLSFKDGYVTGSHSISVDDMVIEQKEKPDDFSNGYWNYVDGEWVLDEVKYNQYWSVV